MARPPPHERHAPFRAEPAWEVQPSAVALVHAFEDDR